jgi:hypothetical protein
MYSCFRHSFIFIPSSDDSPISYLRFNVPNINSRLKIQAPITSPARPAPRTESLQRKCDGRTTSCYKNTNTSSRRLFPSLLFLYSHLPNSSKLSYPSYINLSHHHHHLRTIPSKLPTTCLFTPDNEAVPVLYPTLTPLPRSVPSYYVNTTKFNAPLNNLNNLLTHPSRTPSIYIIYIYP